MYFRSENCSSLCARFCTIDGASFLCECFVILPVSGGFVLRSVDGTWRRTAKRRNYWNLKSAFDFRRDPDNIEIIQFVSISLKLPIYH